MSEPEPEPTTPTPSASSSPQLPGERRARLGLELLAVLGVSYGLDGITSLLSFLRSQLVINHGLGFSNVATAPLKSGTNTNQVLDIADQVASIAQGVAPAFLAIVLLLRNPGGPGVGIGLERWRSPRELGLGAGFAALIGIPGLGLIFVAREIGANAQIVVTDFPDVWYRVPTLIVEAFQQGVGEEIVVCAFVLTRLAQLNWTNSRALTAAAILRGSYHLYQGYGGFVGNAVMGLIFGWWFQRTRRVVPLVIAHFVIDAVSFVGYIYLHDKVSWI